MHVVSRLRTRLEECHAELLCESCSLLSRYDLFVQTVCLITDQDLLHVLTGMQLNLADPISDIIEAIFYCAIVGKNYSHGSLVVSLRDGPKSFLPSGVPNLKFHVLSINLYCLDLKIDSYKEKS